MASRKVSAEQRKELLALLKARFEKNMKRHKGLDWDDVQARLEKDAGKLWSLHEMKRTGGEPDVVGQDETTGEFMFVDCSAESPKGRRSVCVDVELELDEPFTQDHCGSCHACVDACPTNALLGRDAHGAPVMDARRCISYLTIEHLGSIPRELRPLMGNRVFGCDICQEVCPFIRKFSSATSEPAFAARAPGAPPVGVQLAPGASKAHPGTASPSLIELLNTALDETAWDGFSQGSPIRRAGWAGFARNVCVALGNWGSPEAVPVLTAALSDPEPLVREHAAWAFERVDSAEALGALADRLADEESESVREEIRRALDPGSSSRR